MKFLNVLLALSFFIVASPDLAAQSSSNNSGYRKPISRIYSKEIQNKIYTYRSVYVWDGINYKHSGKKLLRVEDVSENSNPIVTTTTTTTTTTTRAPTTTSPPRGFIEPSSVGCDSDPEELKEAFLLLINEARSQNRDCGSTYMQATPPLQWNDLLAQAAMTHSLDMVRNDFFSHSGSDGTTSGMRATEAGYIWNYIGENIAGGQRNAQIAHDALMNSSGHCLNIMRSNFSEFGAACISDSNTSYFRYWTIVFGRPF